MSRPTQSDDQNTSTAIEVYQTPEQKEIQRLKSETLRLNRETAEINAAAEALYDTGRGN